MMVTKKDLIIAVLCAFCLTATLFMMVPTRSSPDIGEYDPWRDLNDDGTIDIFDCVLLSEVAGTNGTPIKNVNVTNWPDEMNVNVANWAEPTTTKIAIYEIAGSTSSSSYSKGAELVVPPGEKWYLYKMTFWFDGHWGAGHIRLVIKNITMMDEINGAYLTQQTVFELKRPLELLEGEKIELWLKYTGGSSSFLCCLIIEAWVEGM